MSFSGITLSNYWTELKPHRSTEIIGVPTVGKCDCVRAKAGRVRVGDVVCCEATAMKKHMSE